MVVVGLVVVVVGLGLVAVADVVVVVVVVGSWCGSGCGLWIVVENCGLEGFGYGIKRFKTVLYFTCNIYIVFMFLFN